MSKDTNVPAPEAPKKSRLWLKNSKGKPDAALTIMICSFAIVTFAYLASIIGTITVGATVINFSAFDVTYATAITVPLMGLYFGRRWTDANAKNSEPIVENEYRG